MHLRVSRSVPVVVVAVVLTAWFGGRAASAQAPQAAQARPAAQEQDIKVLPLTANVYMLVGAGGNVTLQVEPAETQSPRIPGTYRGGYGVLVVDSGLAASADKLRASIRQISQGPLRYIINTHIHPDHMGGNEALGKPMPGGRGGAAPTILAHENMLLQLASPEGNEARLPVGMIPTDAYLDVKELWFNGESIQVFHVPTAHTDADSIVYFRRSDVISTGDIFSTTSYPLLDAQRHGSIQGVIDGLDKILDLAVPESNEEGGTKIVPGHGRLSDEADVVEYRNMVVIVRDRIQDLVKKGMTLEQVKAAKPTLDYDFRYGSTTGRWTTDMFITAIYNEIKAVQPAPPKPGSARGKS